MHIALAITLLLICFYQGYIRNAKQFEATLMYVIICDLLYSVLCHKKILWEFKPDFLTQYLIITNLIHTFIILPCITIIYLSRFPYHEGAAKKTIYLIKWVIGSLLIESLFIFTDRIFFNNGYEVWMEAPFYLMMYIMLYIHYTKRVLNYTLSLIIIVILMLVFQVPL